jgi:ribonuclease G
VPWFRRKARETEQAPVEAAARTVEEKEKDESRGGMLGPAEPEAPAPGDPEAEASGETPKKPRRRGTRGGRGRKKQSAAADGDAADGADGETAGAPGGASGEEEPAARPKRSRAKPKAAPEAPAEEEKPKPARRRRTATPRRATLPAVRKEMLISHDAGEQRVAILEDSMPVEVYLGRPGRQSIAGNVYKGVVDNVLPGMEASFVDIGLEKNGFLYVDEIVVPELEGKRHGRRIQDLIKRGEEVLVQAVKDPMGTKGARLTTEISLPGRFLVYVPFGDGIGVSRRLEDEERERLKALCKGLELPDGGIIVRTAAEGASEEELAGDLAFLRKLWSTIQGRAARAQGPTLVYREAELPLRVVRDLFLRDFERLAVDHERTYRRIVSYLKRTSPELAQRVEWYRDAEPLMERSGVDAAVRSTLDRRVDLPSGGYLIFDYAEAFTVIDVNTGRFVGARGKSSGARLEDTITKNNLEAAKEIVRQLRLRDIGGIIVIDFIDMANPKNRHEVEEALKRELERDRTKTYVVEISPLGLVEMTRQNVTDGPREILTTRCPVCHGDGIVVSDETHAVEAERRLRRLAATSSAEAFLVELPAQVAGILVGPAGSRLAEIERETGKRFAFEARDDLPPDHLVVLREGTAAQIEPTALPVAAGAEVELELSEVHRQHPEDAIGRLDGYVVSVAGAAALVGTRARVRIERATRTAAYASLADAAVAEAPVELDAMAEAEDGAGPPAAAKPRARRSTRGTGTRRKAAQPAPPGAEAGEASPAEGDTAAPEAAAGTEPEAGEAEAPPKPKTRRGSRGGRGRRKPAEEAASAPEATAAAQPDSAAPAEPAGAGETAEEAPEPGAVDGEAAEAKPKKKTRRGSRGGRGRKKPASAVSATGSEPAAADGAGDADPPALETGEGAAANGDGGEEAPPKKRTRRGTRGGRGRRKAPAASSEGESGKSGDVPAGEPVAVEAADS